MLESLAQFQLKARELEPDAFRRFCRTPIFIIDPFQPVDDSGFRTLPGQSGDATPAVGHLVGRLLKRPGSNAFATMITIGRAANNDVEVPAKDVSKFHAYVRTEADGTMSFTDAGSSFGTTLDGRKLEPRFERAPLVDGVEIRLGSTVRMVFVAAAHVQQRVIDLIPRSASARLRRP